MEKSQNCIECSACNRFIHAHPQKSCALIQDYVYRELANKRHDYKWDCPKCVALSLPFAELNDDDLFFEMARPRK